MAGFTIPEQEDPPPQDPESQPTNTIAPGEEGAELTTPGISDGSQGAQGDAPLRSSDLARHNAGVNFSWSYCPRQASFHEEV
ncbi:unnamed protein product [Phytophthora fragariaefolia]|uniref:Unnamed protein product n=1 Tax=Phytophthora fragariaefolia TaxID=1490495 RepID=A0A9W6Y1S4_9STRA|nr:unnamed protein product [Phytophthora fragariaefolia]